MELLAEMQQKGLAPNSITYSASVSAFEKAQQPHQAMELLDEMLQKGRAPNALTTAWQSVHAGSQAASQGLVLLAEMQ